MLPDLQSSLLCDDVRQERNGKMIFIGAVEMIGSPQFPLPYPRLCLVNRWCSGSGAFAQQSRILYPDRTTVFREGSEVTIRLPDEEHMATHVEIFLEVVFEEPGTYWVEVLREGQLTLSYPLRVALLDANESGGMPPPHTML